MQLDTALNLIWLLLGILALAGTLRGSRQKSLAKEGRAPVWLHFCGVALVVAALFPFISATDDVLRIEHMNLQHTPDHQQSGKKTPSESLIRLYEAMDTPLVCAVREVSLTLFFVSVIVAPVLRRVDRSSPRLAGRSPPTALA